ncbi:MBL fold metallo-hydrolase [Dactylosporangium matsuzakiense]|uniref:MBL fold metallo-hydrolase n=1 Tax=Dactylosporangium matsuzakiense TaxID=53360 RepID=A0A9W6KVU3_9ACTN|nr:MBL fold metallo-hydrolase [Dactylosporangium matsuzakiense]GLL08238.1 MBL fold metallo-hydrolase [Dactylosporangium matsuzakiense]
MVSHVTTPAAEVLAALPDWVTLVRAPNPGPMTLDGTNTWLLRAPGGGSVVVDPGPLDEGHLRAVAAHSPVAAIVLTHGHIDHTEGVRRLAELTGARVYDPPVLEHLDADGVVVEPLVTPGHSRDSVCFVVRYRGEELVLTGDTILGRGTTVVAWPDGDLGDYFESLGKLAALDGRPALPGHGPSLSDTGVAARYYRRHREARLEQVRAAVAGGASEAGEVVAAVYADVDRSLWPAAEMSVRAQLDFLRRESHHGLRGLDSA